MTMSQLGLGLLYALAVLGIWGLWLAEVAYLKGWDGLHWADGFNWSSIPICVGISALASWVVPAPGTQPRRGPFVATNTGLTMGAFVVARAALYEMVTSWWPTAARFEMVAVRLLVAGLAVTIGTPLLASWLLAPLQRWTSALLGLVLVLILPLSSATVVLVSGAGRDDWQGFKLGYPIMWTAACVPLTLRLGRRRERSPLPRGRAA